ncbi:MAG: M14 family metallopeptidase [Planctomycetota bacterium]|nr:M14 family metallopeptidase [Planctomycetota bacterium]
MNRPMIAMSAGFLVLSAFVAAPCQGQFPYPSKVDLRFDHWYDYQEMTQALHDLVAAYPELLAIESIGKSVAGRDMWLVTLNNPATGPDTDKPAMFIDGNIHGNEIQAAETVLYSIWYLTKSYGEIEKLTKLVDERAFYFLPMENPDGREVWFHEPATPHYLRGGVKPTDNDHDGLYDEDPPDDLDGDGHITGMWREDPLGRWKRDPDDERFFTRVKPDEPPGGWTSLGQEGIDNDGDGQINEDGPGGYDPNRNWPSDWQPNYIQFGAGDYPFSLPETRAVGQFMLAHPNVAAYQSYHNAGGMILRGPAASYLPYPREDVRVFEQLQETGAEMLPFYRPMVTHKDLYTVHGGEKGWAYEGLGIIGFTNELWTDKRMYAKDDGPSQEERRQFRDLLQFEDVYVPYHEFDHPTYGKILIGGTKKFSSRVTPPWMLEEGCHRNFAFTMFHADQMPQVRWGIVQVKQTAEHLWELTVEVKNEKIIPSILALARQKKIGARDVLACTAGPEARVAASGTVRNLLPTTKLTATERDPHRIWIDRGIPSRGRRLFRFIIEGTGSVELAYVSQKGGTIRRTVDLKEPPIEAAQDED